MVELLVVLAIGAMLVGLVPVAFNKLQEGSQYRDAVRNIITDLRQAHQQALSRGAPVVFQMDVESRQFGIQGQAQKHLPPSLEVKTESGQLNAAASRSIAQIAFLPEGGSTGGTIDLQRPSGAGTRIRVDWLLGQISQEPRQP